MQPAASLEPGRPVSQPFKPEVAIGACLVGLLILFLITRSNGVLVATGITVAFAGFALLVLRTERRRWGLLGIASPLTIYAFYWFIFFGVFGIGAFDPAVYPFDIPDSDIVTAMGVSFLALLLVGVGYRISTTGATAAVTRFVGDRSQPLNSLGAVYVCLVIGWLARLYRIESGAFGYLSFGSTNTGILYRFVQLADGLLNVGLVILAVAAWSRYEESSISRRGARRLLIVNILPLLVITGLASGVKGQLLSDLLPVGLMYLLLRGRVPWRAVALMFVYLLVSYSGAQSFRADISEGYIDRGATTSLFESATEVTGRIVHSWTNDPPQQHFKDFWEGVTTEYATTPLNLALVIEDTPKEAPFLGVRRLFTAPLFFIPTKYLGDPAFNVGAYFATTYLRTPPTTSVFPTQPGDFFMSGGWPVLIVGEILVGVLLGLVWRLIMVRSMTKRAAVLYVIVAAQFANAGLDWGSLSRGVLQMVVFYGIVLRFLLREPRARAIEPSQAAVEPA